MRTKCGSPFYDRHGVIQSLGFPDRFEHGDCIWDIHPKNKSVLLLFENFDIPHSHECRDTFVAVKDDSGVSPKRLCGRMDPFAVLVQAHKVLLASHAERESHGNLQGFSVRYLTLNESVSEAMLDTDWVVNLTNADISSIDAAWSHYNPSQLEDIVLYAVVCVPTLREAGLTILTVNKALNSTEVGRLLPYTDYDAYLVVLIKNVQTAVMSFTASPKRSFRTKEGVPSEPPENVETTTDISTIYITWRHIRTDSVNGLLLGYKVFYRPFYGDEGGNDGGDVNYLVLTVDPDVFQATIENASSNAVYEIKIAGYTATGVGVFSEPVHVRPSCQNDIKDKMRVITSPGFPRNYPDSVECIWFFEQEVPTFDIVVAIDTFHTEESYGEPNCTDYLGDFLGLVNINPVTIAAGPFCGIIKSPFAVTTRGFKDRRALLYFRTNNGLAFKGFNATYFALTDTSKISVVLDSIDSYKVQITWNVSDVAEQIQEFFVFYQQVGEKNIWKFKKTKKQEATILNLQPSTHHKLRVVGYKSSRDVYTSDVVLFVTVGGLKPTPSAPVPRMYIYGDEAGDKILPSALKFCFRIAIPDIGMQFFSKRHKRLYICPNGVIQFGIKKINQAPYNFGQRHWLKRLPMLASYWAPTDLQSFVDGPSKVFYHAYDKYREPVLLQKATADVLSVFYNTLPTKGKTFEASWALVVTWQDIRHQKENDVTKTLHNTFQAVIVTDGIFSFVIYNYPHGGIQYSAPANVSRYKRRKDYFVAYKNYKRFPVVGVNSGDKTGNFSNLQRSGTIQIENIDTLVGNAKIPGRNIFRLENSNGEEDGRLKCERWYGAQPRPNSYSDELDPCPCSIIQAVRDERYQWVRPYVPYTEDTLCFYTRFPSKIGRGRRCCYSTSPKNFGALITGFPGGGAIDRYHRLTPSLRVNYTANDLHGYSYCCLESKMCRKYYEKRPSEGCEKYEAPWWSWLWGDPHIVTLDSKNYTFNGLGEYTMLDINEGMFQLQSRTKLAKGGGSATVFVAAVAQEVNTSTVQVNLKDEGGLEVLIDSKVFQNYSSLTNVSVNLDGSVSVGRPKNNSFFVTFPSGVSVTVIEIQGSLSIVVAAPTKFKSHTKGLLGTWNDDPLDDFLSPDGTTLSSNATGREIHFDFGQKWQVTSNTSLFTYNPGENTTTFANKSFTPIFLDEDLFGNNTELRKKAEETCQGDVNCLFDIASTGDTSVGESTKQVSVQLESESQELQNYPPKILSGPTEFNATVNTTATITVVAEDPNNDSLTFTVTGTLPTGYTTSTNDSSMTLTWGVTTTKINMEFIITDGSANTVLRPVINVCACHNQGICIAVQEDDVDDNSDEGSNEERFQILPCACQNGYTGALCDADLDACEANFQPCFPGVVCNDLPPPANNSGFKCGPCPSGYSGDGLQCLDVDECSKNSDGCQHDCINTAGSFVCTCNSGYSLAVDKKTCQDVDECSPVSDCMHICENTPGGYNCKCNQDFKVDDADSKKCIPENPCQQNQHGCEHVCYQSDGQDKCSCRAGYTLNQDGKTCSDLDECATNQHRCTQGCKNTVGSYLCSCVNGFTLDSNGFSCNDIDECLAWTFNCTDVSQKCKNSYGSYKCVCDEGLYWIDKKCKGLDKGEAPPPPPAALSPRTPSDEEKSQSVNLEIQGLNISQWNEPLQEKFKTTLAEVATKHCSAEKECQSKETSSRRRRAANYITFTEDQVHLLPGYPKQISKDPLLASLAFYLQFPPGSSSPVIKKDVLVAIVQGSMAEISRSINANISSVQTLFAETTPSVTPTVPTTISTEKDESKNMNYIIGGCVAGGVVLVLVVIAAIWCCKRKNGIGKQRVDSEQSITNRGQKMEMDVVNYGYGQSITPHH